MRIRLAYGREGLWVDLPEEVTVLEPHVVPGLPDEPAAIQHALRHPIGTPPLRELVSAHDTVAIVFSDLTRPMPNERVLPVLLAELDHVPPERITLINALGTHRPNTGDELRRMLGDAVYGRYPILQHDPWDKDQMVRLGVTRFGHEVWINRVYLDASARILTGFIEPHIFAGFSGGPKAVLPGIAGMDTILDNHQAAMIAHPQATWGVTEGNPIWEEMWEVAAWTRPTFLLNVTLNQDRAITGVFAGDWLAAHRVGAALVRQSAWVMVPTPFDIVLVTNAGYPLDLNLYQAVKGMSAAARIVKPGGSIILAAECWDGIPDHGEYKRLLYEAASPRELLDRVLAPGFRLHDQWEAQLHAQLCLHAEVHLYSHCLSDEDIRRAHLIPCRDIAATVRRLLERHGPGATVAALPAGPLTIPTVRDPAGRVVPRQAHRRPRKK